MAQNQTPQQTYRDKIKEQIPVLESAVKEFEQAIIDGKAVGQDVTAYEQQLVEVRTTLQAYKAQFGG